MKTDPAASRFLAEAGRQLRTHLDDIIKMTSLTLAADLTDEVRSYLERVEFSSDALLTVVNDFLDLSRIETGHLELEHVPFGLRDLVTDVVRSVAPQAADREVSLSPAVEPQMPDALMGDPGRLRQVLVTVIGNTVAATSSDQVRISVATEHRDQDTVTLRFAVEDVGTGQRAEAFAKAFEPWTRNGSPVGWGHDLAGLSVEIAAEIVKMMGGEISVETTDTANSVFFTAGFETCRHEDLPGAQPSHEAASDLPVFVVADTVEDRRSLVASLSGSGMAPVATTDAESALTMTGYARQRGQPPQAVVIAGGEDPFEESRKFVEKSPVPVPVVVLVSSGQRGDASRCRQLGIAGYLPRPLAPGDLADTVNAVIAADEHTPTLVTRHWLREGRKSLRVLVAEDGRINRLLVTRMLEARGHSVATVENGLEAVDAVEAKPFDVVLMDVAMPIMDGLEATAAIRAAEVSRGHGERMPIVGITADTMKADRQRSLDAGMDDYLAKPHRPEQLLAVVERLGTSTPAAGPA